MALTVLFVNFALAHVSNSVTLPIGRVSAQAKASRNFYYSPIANST
jgi:hypothetical protein